MTDDTFEAESTSARAAAQNKTTSKRRWIIAVVLMLLVVTGYLDRISVAVLFNDTEFQSAMGLVSIGASRHANDRLLPRLRIILTSVELHRRSIRAAKNAHCWLACLGRAHAGYGSAMSYASMLTSRIALGLLKARNSAGYSKLSAAGFRPKEHGRANSIWLMGSPLGSAIGFPLIIFLVTDFGWRKAFWVLGISVSALWPPSFGWWSESARPALRRNLLLVRR